MKLHSREWPKCHAYQIQGVRNGNVSLCISYAYKKKQSIIVVHYREYCTFMCLRRSCFSLSESTQDKEPTKAATVFQMTISLWVPPLLPWKQSRKSSSLVENSCLFRKIIRGEMISNTALQIMPYFWNIKTVYSYKYVNPYSLIIKF